MAAPLADANADDPMPMIDLTPPRLATRLWAHRGRPAPLGLSGQPLPLGFPRPLTRCALACSPTTTPALRVTFRAPSSKRSATSFARRGQFVTVWTPHDADWARPTWKRSGAGSVTLRPYRYAWPARLQRWATCAPCRADLALRLSAYASEPAALFGAGHA